MASENKPANTQITDIEKIQSWLNKKAGKSVTEYSFYQLVELLNKLHSQKTALNNENAIQFRASANTAFPTRDVVSLRQDEQGQFDLEVSFLGLHGSQSPLPGYYLDHFAWEDAQQANQLTDYLNLFNHRLVTLLHRIWRKYRYYICFEDGGHDAFSRHMFSLVGLGSEANRGMMNINHSKMLAYAGLLASPSRSPDVICSLISHCFDLEKVELIGWEIRKVAIPEDQQNRLGIVARHSGQKSRPKMVLGENFNIGSHIYDCNGKCTIEISELPLDRYMSFLPNGKDFLSLITFVSYIMHEQLAWDLRLRIADKQANGICLGKKQHNQLGWQSFLGKPEANPSVTMTILE